MLSKLFSSLDEGVFTAELKSELEAQFNEAVELKSTVLASELVEERIDELTDKSEEHIDFLTEKAQQFVDMKETEMVDILDKYLDKVVETFVSDSRSSLAESITSERADLVLEAFDTMLVSAGVEIAEIVEAKDDNSTENELTESIRKYDRLIDDNIALQEENKHLLCMGIVNESVEGMSVVQAENFKKLANLVEFEKTAEYGDKLDTIRESVISTPGCVNEDQKPINKPTLESDSAPVWAHLV